jgi:pimeloyl-ACP methyl ester carboxylesterase
MVFTIFAQIIAEECEMNNILSHTAFGQKKVELVFLHGFCEDSRMWSEFIEDSQFNAVAVDLPGYGSSEDIKFTTLKDMADKLHQTLQELKVSDFILVGHSMGGYVALEYLANYPDELRGLALIHSHPFPDGEERKDQRQRSIEFVEKYGVEAYAKQFFPKLFATENRDNFAIHSLSLRATQLNKQTIINSQHAMVKRKDHSETVEKADIPVLFLLGTQDNLVNLKSATEIAVAPERSMIKIYEHTGHMSMFEKPNTLRNDLKKFIEFCEMTVLS